MKQPCSLCGCAAAKGSLAELPVGTKATIVGISPQSRGRKKFADVGIVPGTELLIEAHAPFGGLIQVKVMETSMALHKDDAACIMLEKTEDADNE
jgi:Fe2+ transport system protein FeoA